MTKKTIIFVLYAICLGHIVTAQVRSVHR